jgi:4-cresol dehydrogenase (hydroxylating)
MMQSSDPRKPSPVLSEGDEAPRSGPAPSLAERLRAIVGEGHVSVAPEDVESETRTCVPFRRIPDCVVYPGSAEEVQRIVTLAQELDAKLTVVSTGKNWGYGARSASYEGGITIVLERMKRIEVVDEALGYAVIEPGVTYRELNDHLRRNGLALWSDCAGSTEAASVIGNALDKGRGLTPYADHFGALCGLEVVLPDGSLLRTGNVTETPNRVWHLYKWGVGPYLDGLFVQSNLGIVVKAGVWLMPAPEAFDLMVFEYTAETEHLPAMIDALRGLVFKGALRSRPHIANDFAMLCISSQFPWHLSSGERALTADALAAWRREHGVTPWTFACGLYGTAAEVRAQRRALRKSLGRFGRLWSFGVAGRRDWLGRARFEVLRLGARALGKSRACIESIRPAADLFRGIPTDDFVRQVYFKSHDRKPTGPVDPARDGCGFIWVGPVVPFMGADVANVLAMARAIYQKHDFDFFVEILIESPRALIVLFGLFYRRDDPEESQRAAAWLEEIRAAMIDAGYPPYRETAQHSPHAFDGNPAARRFLSAVKTAIDPKHRLAPGRYGLGSTD